MVKDLPEHERPLDREQFAALIGRWNGQSSDYVYAATLEELEAATFVLEPEHAIHSEAFPCNPRPFARRIDELCEERGSGAIKSPEARACLWVLMGQAYGQLWTVDGCAEWDELTKLIPKPPGF
jgi:hypothetical protein